MTVPPITAVANGASPLGQYAPPAVEAPQLPARPLPRTSAPTPWGLAHHAVRCCGDAGLPEAALPPEYADAIAGLVRVGFVRRATVDGRAVLLAVSPSEARHV